VNCGQTCPLPWQGKPSELVVAQRQIPVAPFDMRTRPLDKLRKLFGRLSQAVVGLGTQLTQGAAGFAPGLTQAAGQLPKRLAMAHRLTSGEAIERKRGKELRMHGV
jgi:hypothetical protein